MQSMKTNINYNKNKMRIIKQALGILCLGVLFSCNNVDFKKTKSGIPYKYFPSKTGKAVLSGNIVKAEVVQKIQASGKKDSILYNTYTSTPAYFQIANNPVEPYSIPELFPLFKKQGDSIYAVQAVDTFINRNPMMAGQMPFKKGDKIVTTVKVIDVFTSPEDARADETKERSNAFDRDQKIQTQLKADDQILSSYIAQHGIKAQKVGKGTYVEVLDAGTGDLISDGKWVSLKYRGTTLEGKAFDSNMDTTFHHTEPLEFTVGRGGMLRGFEEGIRGLHKGAKVNLYIPSVLAYGANSPSPALKPNENLIFHIEVLDVKDQAPTPKGMPSRMDTASGK
jgi:FKBP-type peptidyl-prolyl cis-trans isomerase FkpA